MSLKLGVNGGRRNAGRRWGAMFRRRPQMQNPMLVLNMSIFNFETDNWSRTFSPFKLTRTRLDKDAVRST